MPRILVLDDSQDDLDLINRYCTKHGWRCYRHKDQDEALAALAAEDYDVFVLDHNLNGKRDGGTIARDLRADGIETPIVLISGSLTPQLREQVDDIDLLWCVQKNGTWEALGRVIKMILLRPCAGQCEVSQPICGSHSEMESKIWLGQVEIALVRNGILELKEQVKAINQPGKLKDKAKSIGAQALTNAGVIILAIVALVKGCDAKSLATILKMLGG